MTSKEFWEDDPNLFATYRFSFIEKEKREMEKGNYFGWLYGLYNHDGNTKLMSSLKHFISGLFKQQPNPEIDPYPVEPYDLTGKKQKKTKAEVLRLKNDEYLNAFADFKKKNKK